MKIICNNTKNIIIVVAFACICLASAAPAEAACYQKQVCDIPVYGPSCPSWQPYYVSTQVVAYGSSPSMACWPIGGYLCGLGNFMVCCAASSPWAGGWGNWSYPSSAVVGYNCHQVEVCNGECDNSILNACTTPNSLIASFGQTDDANYWYWYCPGKGPGGSDSPQCSLHKPVPGACRTFLGGIDPLPTASNQLCADGTASAVSGLGTNSSPWSWTCSGQYGGSPSGICTAKKPCVYDNYRCNRSGFDVECANTYPENCGKSLPVNMVCSARDVNGTCSGVLSQSDCVAAGVPCANTTENCASCPLEPGIWREVTP